MTFSSGKSKATFAFLVAKTLTKEPFYANMPRVTSPSDQISCRSWNTITARTSR